MTHKIRMGSICALAALFVMIGLTHFIHPDPFVRIVPGFLPCPLVLVWVSGVFEIILGAGLLIRHCRRCCGLALIVLLFAVFPANINMAVNHIDFGGRIPAPLLWLRLPVQFLLMYWIWWSIKPNENKRNHSDWF